jgi:diaminohydroxyphosphoribosylaminopyrimidine deaminase/5-amino-6-(5-phosphoribosylamino)uracil reductase
MDDLEAMRLALANAHAVEGRTAPRPSVGAVVVRDGEVVGQGATSPPYGPHAEVHALQAAGTAAHGADLYVSLEPCCVAIHTPPCTDAIIAAGIRRVVIGAVDPNPQVHEKGIAQLRAAGVEVVTDLISDEAREIVLPFYSYIRRNRPYVTAKWAMTLDGKLATSTGDAYWISGEQSRIWVHNLRDRVDAIMIGAGTAHADNPQLTVRLSDETRDYQRAPRSGPLRVILSTHGQLHENLHVLQPALAAGTCVIVGEHCPLERIQRLQSYGVAVLTVALNEQGQIDLILALQVLAQQGIMHVLLEGGAKLLGNAFDASLIDHVAAFIAPKLVGGAAAPSPIQGQGIARMREALSLQCLRSRQIGEDILIEGDLPHDPQEVDGYGIL